MTFGAWDFQQKETLVQVFSSEFCQIFQNTFLQNTSGGCFCYLLFSLLQEILWVGKKD